MVILAESMGKHWIASPVFALRRCSFPSIIVDAGSGESSLSDMMEDESGLMYPKICGVVCQVMNSRWPWWVFRVSVPVLLPMSMLSMRVVDVERRVER
jgi:hypothetical protein